MRLACILCFLLSVWATPSLAQTINIGGDVGNFFEQRKTDLGNARKTAEQQVNHLKDQAIGAVEKATKDAGEAGKRAVEEAKKQLEAAGEEANKAVNDIYNNARKGVDDYNRNFAKAANDIVDAGQAVARFAEREISGYGATFNAAERRIRQGKIVDALWHFHTEPLQRTDENAARLATENQLANQAMQSAASYYGGPAGASAYAAWLTYHQTGNAEMALRVGIAVAAQSYASGGVKGMPEGTAGELAKKAIVAGAAGGIAVAASGGDNKAVQEAFLKQGGMVLMQGGKSYITKKFDAAAGKADSFCTSSIGTSCKPVFDAVERDADGNVIFTQNGLKMDGTKFLASKTNIGNWTDASSIPKSSQSLPGIPSVLVADSNWSISWDKNILTSKSINAPAVAITYVGPASPYRRAVEELTASIGSGGQQRQSAPPAAATTLPELWVALGDVGVKETSFSRLFVKSKDALSVGDIVRAQVAIHARPGPAAFGRPAIILPKGNVLVIGEIRELPTRLGVTQRWARLDLDVN